MFLDEELDQIHSENYGTLLTLQNRKEHVVNCKYRL